MDFNLKHKTVDNAEEAFKFMFDLVNLSGQVITSRGEPTKEVLNAAVTIINPRDRIVPIPAFKLGFVLQELFDILNENPPRKIHSKDMLKKTMGDENNDFFFGNEMRQALSRHSLLNIYSLFEQDKNTRKAVLDLSTRRPVLHYPCLIYAHFIIRDDELHMTLETRGTSIFLGLPHDIFIFTCVQEIMLGWLQELYPDLKMGQFTYKTISTHFYSDENGNAKEDSVGNKWNYDEWKSEGLALPYDQYVGEMGKLYYYVDQLYKAHAEENLEKGHLLKYSDVLIPGGIFKSNWYEQWAMYLYMENDTMPNIIDPRVMGLK
jgi:hypothetical protein